MRIVAIIAARNEAAYLTDLLPYLEGEQIEVILIDNDSSDGTSEIFSPARQANVLEIRRLSFGGHFDLSAQLAAKAEIASLLQTDWIIHQDADEILQSANGWGGLRHNIELADSRGFNVLNFNELVMLPYDPANGDVIRNSRRYYFFEPRPLRLMRAWKQGCGLSNVATGGHVLKGRDPYVCPERMLLKHFIVRSQEHAYAKYLGRTFSAEDLSLGWHRQRIGLTREDLELPIAGADLHLLDDPRDTPVALPRSTRRHFWEWGKSDR